MKSLIIDAGNTRIKAATYLQSKCYDIQYFQLSDLNFFFDFLKKNHFDHVILCSVLQNEDTQKIISELKNPIILTKDTKLPLKFDYDSRQTLGKDRIANAVYGAKATNSNCLIIDIGTCIKFDFVSSDKTYLGGSISPGLQMRFTAMHEHTGKLPLLKNITPTKLIGNSTVNSMTSGVMNGAKFEIEGMINAYQKDFKDLVIFVTGGDAKALKLESSTPLIYDEHLTLNGLFYILQDHI